ncbi:Mif2/CENP-C like [Teratosphaeria destructans]|uniref:Mif2/CENP-C like n=1 Tax=Teratosphaeria destructans TaxID=418781 RepID=A0A9W7T193_9PEZI|nr:Mif2/CENP-C like [Teratosphaeria destructans]
MTLLAKRDAEVCAAGAAVSKQRQQTARPAPTHPSDRRIALLLVETIPSLCASVHNHGKLDIEKENRPPRGMATSKDKMTPGRRRKAQDQYFDVGKVGRKTGITLPDKGIRDEHGLEPVSGIFSSPIVSPQRNGDRTLTSSDMHVQESSAPEVEQTLHLRKTPKFPPPRVSTPKHTNIGSPKRMSTGRAHTTGKKQLPLSDDEASPVVEGSRTQPPANRKLDFGGRGGVNGVRRSIESNDLDAFRPKNTLRRSTGVAPRSNPFASPVKESLNSGPSLKPSTTDQVESEEQYMPSEPPLLDDAPIMMDDGYEEPAVGEEDVEDERSETPSHQLVDRFQESLAQLEESGLIEGETTALSRKRDRTVLEDEGAVEATEVSPTQHTVTNESTATKRQKRRASRDQVIVHREDEDSTIDPALLAHGDEYLEEELQEEVEEVEPEVQPRNRGKGTKGKAAALKERDSNRGMRAQSSPAKIKNGVDAARGSPSKRGHSRGASVGPVSNVNLRATTPYEDARSTTRFGRPVLKPLQYWANETRIWKNGEVEGIIRAEEVEKPKVKRPRKRKARKNAKGGSSLEAIDEESDTESVFPDEWEETVGVIAGKVANWNVETQQGDPDDPIHEDLAFASSSIVTRDVAGAEFKYAKVMTLPFFGSGLVELPPEGFKRAKNSRKMQMCFFVHEGKVMVEIGAQGMPGDVNQFAISKGGVWVVPRGNNYSITNESRTKTAKIFFSQGCEVEAGSGGQ